MSTPLYNIVPSPSTSQGASLIHYNERAHDAGLVANDYAKASVFTDYAKEQSDNTIRRQRADLALFAEYLCAAGLFECPDDTADEEERRKFFTAQGEKMRVQPENWHIVTHGLVKAFKFWQEQRGYATGSINVRLSTVKKYCTLAFQAGVIAEQEEAMIGKVAGYNRKTARRTDERREVTRLGDKKAESVTLSKEQADALKDQPDTPQGRRDAVIMALLLDHGLRVGELAALEVSAFNLKDRTMRFYRQKVDKTQTHKLTTDSFAALAAWLKNDAPAMGPLLRGSRKGGKLEDFEDKKGQRGGMTERSLTERVRALGESERMKKKGLDVAGLSAHDCRHYWATRAAHQGTNPFELQEAGGWSSLAMPRRYVENAKIANEGVKL